MIDGGLQFFVYCIKTPVPIDDFELIGLLHAEEFLLHLVLILDKAVEHDDAEVAEVLRSQGAKHSLFFAVNVADLNLARELLQQKADPFLRDNAANKNLFGAKIFV